MMIALAPNNCAFHAFRSNVHSPLGTNIIVSCEAAAAEVVASRLGDDVGDDSLAAGEGRGDAGADQLLLLDHLVVEAQQATLRGQPGDVDAVEVVQVVARAALRGCGR